MKIHLRNLKDYSWKEFEGTIESLQPEFEKRNIVIALSAKIGNRAIVGDYAIVGNCASVGNRARIGDYAIVEKDASVGDYACIGDCSN